jgi:phage portal protein BeeE
MRWAKNLGPTRKSFTQPPFWSPGHPLSVLWGPGTSSNSEAIENNFEGYVQGAFKANGPVFACVTARQIVFSEAPFAIRKIVDEASNGAAGGPERHPCLSILEKPWIGGHSSDILARMEQDASLAGNSYWTVRNGRLVRLRPDWVQIVIGVPGDPNRSAYSLDAEIIAYKYKPNGAGLTDVDLAEEVILLPSQVAHYAPIPDPAARFRGMSWITACAKEVQADLLATQHKKAFYENAAVPNIAVKFDRDTSEDAFDEFVEQYNANHKGAWNAYKTLFLMGGADVTPLTMDFHQLEFNQTVGKGESRIAAVAGVPSSWVGFSEGMQGSALNAGNFGAARRRFADGTIRPLWKKACEALDILIDVPEGYELWYDDRDIPFLREDMLDRAQIFQTQMIAIEAGMRGGFEPDAAVRSAISCDLRALLGQHTGLTSVQMMNTDQEGQRGQEEAQTREIEARAIAGLITAGCTVDSIAAFMESGDASKLKKDPKALVNQAPTGAQGARGDGPEGEARSQRQRALASNQSNKPKPTGGGDAN